MHHVQVALPLDIMDPPPTRMHVITMHHVKQFGHCQAKNGKSVVKKISLRVLSQ